MSQKIQLLDTLKDLIRKSGKTYADIAHHLGKEEITVKRIFMDREVKLSRLESICDFLKIDFSDLVLEMKKANAENLAELSHDQEGMIAGDMKLLLITVLVLNHWSMEDIIRHYKFEEHDCYQYLRQLEEIKLIELKVENKIKLLISPHFKWRENGPIQNLFREKIEKEYFQSDFSKPSEHLTALNIMLSEKSNQRFKEKLETLACEFNAVSKEEASLAIGKRKGSTVILAMRDWDYKGLYGTYRTPKNMDS